MWLEGSRIGVVFVKKSQQHRIFSGQPRLFFLNKLFLDKFFLNKISAVRFLE